MVTTKEAQHPLLDILKLLKHRLQGQQTYNMNHAVDDICKSLLPYILGMEEPHAGV